MIGTIQKVFNQEGKKLGAVVFSDGKKFSTFNTALIATALNGIGQLAEYTTEMNGKYENLASLTLKGAAPAQTAEPQRDNVLNFGALALVSAVKDLTAAVRELTSQLARQPRTAVASPAGQPGGSVPDAAAAPEQPEVDPIDAAQARLAEHVGSADAAEAMFASLKAKHAKSPAKLKTAVDELLAAHGVE